MSPAVLPATKAFLARCGRKVSSALRKAQTLLSCVTPQDEAPHASLGSKAQRQKVDNLSCSLNKPIDRTPVASSQLSRKAPAIAAQSTLQSMRWSQSSSSSSIDAQEETRPDAAPEAPEVQDALRCPMQSIGGGSSCDGSLWSSSLSDLPATQEGGSRASSAGGGAVTCIVQITPRNVVHATYPANGQAGKAEGSAGGAVSDDSCFESVDCTMQQLWGKVDTVSSQRDLVLSVAVAQAQQVLQVTAERDTSNAIAQVAVTLAQQTEEANASLQQTNSELFYQALGNALEAQAVQQRIVEVEAERDAFAVAALLANAEVQQVQEQSAALFAAYTALAQQVQADRLAAEAAQEELSKVQRLLQARQGTLMMLRGELGLLPGDEGTQGPGQALVQHCHFLSSRLGNSGS